MVSSAIYYTDNQIDPRILKKCQDRLRKAFDGEIICVSLQPTDFGDKRIVFDETRGYLTMFKQILAGLEASEADYVFLTEHDVLYPKEHFDFVPPRDDTYYYDVNWWKIREDGLAVHWDADQVSGLCANRELLVNFYKNRIATYDENDFDRKFEPMSGEASEQWKASVPYIDIRHNRNLTYNKWKLDHFRKKDTAVNFQESTIDKIPGWDNLTY